MKITNRKILNSLIAVSLFGMATISFAQVAITQSPYGTGVSVGAGAGYPYPGTYPTSIYQQPQTNPAITQLKNQQAENTKKVDDLSQKLKDAESKPADTASAQGYVDANAELKKAALLEDEALDNTPRQKGVVVSLPDFGRSVLKDRQLTVWLENWNLVLNKYGISQQKVYFEAGRLSKDEFKDWANKEILASTGQWANQQEYVDDPQPHDGDAIPTYVK